MSKQKMVKLSVIVVSLAAIASSLIPWYSSHLRQEALKQAESGQGVEALHTAEQAARLNPLSIDALFTLAGAQQRLGRELESRRTLERATELEPENFEVWKQLAIYERDYWNQPEMAGEHLEKALSLNPADKYLRREVEEGVNGA